MTEFTTHVGGGKYSINVTTDDYKPYTDLQKKAREGVDRRDTEYYEKMLNDIDARHRAGRPMQGAWLSGVTAFAFACARCKNVGAELCDECKCEIRTRYEPKELTKDGEGID